MGSQRGSIKLPYVIAAVSGAGLAASIYLNINQHQMAEQDRKLMQGQITDLTYQVGQDKKASSTSTSPTPTPLATPEPSSTPTPTPAVAGTANITIAQQGVKLTVTDPITDLTYDWVPSGTYSVAALSTRTLISKYATCKPSTANNALGFIVAKKVGVAPNAQNELIKQLGNYKFYYIKPAGFCATDQAGKDALAAARAAVKNSALPTLSDK